MKLYEYEAKKIFADYGIPISPYEIATDPESARKSAEKLGFPVVIKAQVLVAGRGKAGGVKFARDPDEAYNIALQMLGSNIKGEIVKKVMVTNAVNISKEIYVSIIVDRFVRKPVILVSSEGGVDIEELAVKAPEKIIRTHVDPLIGLRDYQLRYVTNHVGLFGQNASQFMFILRALYMIFENLDCDLAEINPLVIDSNGNLIAVDAKIIIDDNALFRRKEFANRESVEYSTFEIEARQAGFNYVELDGNIGIICNGAGLTMATMDTVYLKGGRPANFLDVGGGATSEIAEKATSLLLRHPNVKVIFFNILGGITRCDEVAKGLINALNKYGSNKKIVVRMMGTNEEEGRRLLKEAGIDWYDSMEEAAARTAELAKTLEA
ncbi:MAG: ADP-forming succinate--CoA ligase subunit beta [Thermoprotei archaeon]